MLNKTVPSISCKRQSENRRDSVNASIAGGSPAEAVSLPHYRHGENPVNPLASLAEEDDNKLCLPAKRQRSSTLGIGTVYTPFGSLQEKARRHLPPHASLRRAKLGVFAGESAKSKLESKSKICKSTGVKNRKISLFRRCCEGLCRSHEQFSAEQKVVLKLLTAKSEQRKR